MVCVPVAMESMYQNSPIFPIGVNFPTDQLQEQMIHEKNQNKGENTAGVSDASVIPFPVAVLRPASVDSV